MSACFDKRTDSYYVQFEFKNQRFTRRGFPTKNDAREFEDEWKVNLRKAARDQAQHVPIMAVTVAPPERSALTVKKAFDDYLVEVVAPCYHDRPYKQSLATRASLFGRIVEFLGEKTPLTAVTTERLSDFKRAMLAAGLAPNTVNTTLMNVTVVCRYANKFWGAGMPVPEFKKVPVGVANYLALSEAEADRLLALCEPTPDLRDYAMLLMDTGARRREGLALTWSSILFTEKLEPFVRLLGYVTKNHKMREVPLRNRTIDMLLRRAGVATVAELKQVAQARAAEPIFPWHAGTLSRLDRERNTRLPKRSVPGGQILGVRKVRQKGGAIRYRAEIGSGRGGRPKYLGVFLTREEAVKMRLAAEEQRFGPRPAVGLRKAWERVREELGKPTLRIHDLRHTYATRLTEKDVDIYHIQGLMGHSSTKLTERYAHPSRTVFREVVRKLDS